MFANFNPLYLIKSHYKGDIIFGNENDALVHIQLICQQVWYCPSMWGKRKKMMVLYVILAL